MNILANAGTHASACRQCKILRHIQRIRPISAARAHVFNTHTYTHAGDALCFLLCVKAISSLRFCARARCRCCSARKRDAIIALVCAYVCVMLCVLLTQFQSICLLNGSSDDQQQHQRHHRQHGSLSSLPLPPRRQFRRCRCRCRRPGRCRIIIGADNNDNVDDVAHHFRATVLR